MKHPSALLRAGCVALLALPATTWAQSGDDAVQNEASGYAPGAAATHETLRITGYVDIGWAKAQGNGTSFSPNDLRVPADYGVDTFQPMVNSRGEVASIDSAGLFTNGFFPRSVGIGGRGSFLLNTADVDIRYTPIELPLLVFVRAQFLPRFSNQGDGTRALLEQAFARITPFPWQELAVSVGKFDSVFGVEYLQNEANLRTGITPSLISRYTTGQSIGAKIFYRVEIAPLWSALSINVAGTNSGTFIEALQGPDISLSGIPVLSARLGYELNLPHFQVKLGASGMRGPRNDQPDPTSLQVAYGADARLYLFGFSLEGEYVHVNEDDGIGPGKLTGAGQEALASGFQAWGYYGQLSYGHAVESSWIKKVSVFARYERRHAEFQGFVPILVDRVTPGLRIDLWDALALKVEYLWNRQLVGAPSVPNNVFTTSAVFSW